MEHKEASRALPDTRGPKDGARRCKVSDSVEESRSLSAHHVDNQQKCFFQSSSEDVFIDLRERERWRETLMGGLPYIPQPGFKPATRYVPCLGIEPTVVHRTAATAKQQRLPRVGVRRQQRLVSSDGTTAPRPASGTCSHHRQTWSVTCNRSTSADR